LSSCFNTYKGTIYSG